MILTSYFLCLGVAVIGNLVVGCDLAFTRLGKSLEKEEDVLVLTVARLVGYAAIMILPIKIVSHGTNNKRWLVVVRQIGFVGLPGFCIALSTWGIYLVKLRRHLLDKRAEEESESDGNFLIILLSAIIFFCLILLTVRTCWLYKHKCVTDGNGNEEEESASSRWSANSRGITLTFVGHLLVNFTLQLDLYGGPKALFTKYLGASVLLVYFITFFFLFGRRVLSRGARAMLIILPVTSSILSMVGIAISLLTEGITDRTSLVILFVSDILLNVLLYIFVHENIFQKRRAPTRENTRTTLAQDEESAKEGAKIPQPPADEAETPL